jgi:hypothetical protein
MSQLVKTKRQANFNYILVFNSFVYKLGFLALVGQNCETKSSVTISSLFDEFLCKLGFFWHEWASLKRE